MSAVFKMKPTSIPDGFNWRSHMYHLTYSGLIPSEDVLEKVRRVTSTPLVGWSVVWEDTSYTDDQGVYQQGYTHTHVALIFKARLNLTGSRLMDIYTEDNNGQVSCVHPNIQPKVNMVQMEVIFHDYHPGRKYSIELGKIVYKEPIKHDFHLPPEWEFNRAIMLDIVRAPSLFEACIAGQVRPRTISDVKALREAGEGHIKRVVQKYDRASFKTLFPPGWQVVHVWGGTGLGKTKVAIAQFDNACFIKPFNSIGCLEALCRRYDSNLHDGIILDEADLRFLPREVVIALFDPDEDCVLDLRFKSCDTLPAAAKKILISNKDPKKCYPPDVDEDGTPIGAIERRKIDLRITEKTWKDPAPQPQLLPPQVVPQPAPNAAAGFGSPPQPPGGP